MKKVNPKFYLQLWDGIWSLPLAVLSIIGVGYGIQYFFTDPADMGQGAPGNYQPEFFQLAFIAAGAMVFINSIVWIGMYFNFRGLFRYYFGKKNQNGQVENESKEDFKKLSPWLKIVLLLFVYCFLSVEFFCLLILLM